MRVLSFVFGMMAVWGEAGWADDRAAPAIPAKAAASTVMFSLDGNDWLLDTDPNNLGKKGPLVRRSASRGEADQGAVDHPGGVPRLPRRGLVLAEFHPAGQSACQGRYLLRFWAVDYLAEVWLNGVRVGGHEGGEGVFVLDVTDAIKPGQANRLAVRVLNPTNEPIDGIVLAEIPRRCKVVPFRPGALYNHGGIVDSVELLGAPAVRVEDLWFAPIRRPASIRDPGDAASMHCGGRRPARSS